MSLTINEDSKHLKPHTFQKGDLIFIAIGNRIDIAIYDTAISEDKIYYLHLCSWWSRLDDYNKVYPDGNKSWLNKKINNPEVGARDFTNTHASKRIMPVPREMCTKMLLEIQHDYKKARNLL